MLSITYEERLKFEAQVKEVLARADEKFGTNLKEKVEILFNLRGMCAGQAVRYTDGRLALRFNLEAMDKNWDHAYNNTIPHEVAHLVCFTKPRLGKNHDRGWQAVDMALGGIGERYHTLDLTPGRKVTKYKYKLASGREVLLGPVRHKRLQTGKTKYRNDGEKILAEHWVGE